jgi:hypothetical protein
MQKLQVISIQEFSRKHAACHVVTLLQVPKIQSSRLAMPHAYVSLHPGVSFSLLPPASLLGALDFNCSNTNFTIEVAPEGLLIDK